MIIVYIYICIYMIIVYIYIYIYMYKYISFFFRGIHRAGQPPRLATFTAPSDPGSLLKAANSNVLQC